ncbi:MAG: transporter substrate-binding domain-containing protein, partial [Coriobacteriales bacterium]|nr:transporter substrate-binding domain-containing protein [Coriobacteriales bacterium]
MNIKKIVVSVVVAALLALGCVMIVGCGENQANKTKLIVGFDKEYPPYGYMGSDGQYTGFDLDLAKEVCNRNGWEFKAEPVDWDAKDSMLDAGTITCIWNGFTYEGREDQYQWSEPYMKNAQVVVTKADSTINSLADLAGKVVMTQKSSAAEELLKDGGDKADLGKTFKSLESVGDYNSAFMQLKSGAVDAIACDLSIAAYQISADKSAYKQLEENLNFER